MPFRIDLAKTQEAKKWTSNSNTPAAQELQSLYDHEDSVGYQAKLTQLRKEIAKLEGDKAYLKHDFRLTDGKIYEIFDKGETIDVSIQLMVKGSSITWSFSSPKDETHQTWRDEIFKTAAIAHQSVKNGCETYYRGSNAYHIKKMHSHEGESSYNHNHYRIVRDLPVTPKDLEEHLLAFFNQGLGKKYINDINEVHSIVGKYKIYWSQYELDPRFSAYYPIIDVRRSNALLDDLCSLKNPVEALDSFLEKSKVDKTIVPKAYQQLLAVLPRQFSPESLDQVKAILSEFHSFEFRNKDFAKYICELHKLYPVETWGPFIQAFDEFVNKVNFANDFKVLKGFDSPSDSDVNEFDEYQEYLSILPDDDGDSKSSLSGSPAEQYKFAIDQIMTMDDEIEEMLFSEALTNTCRNIDDAMLGKLRPEDFRKGLRVYNALKCFNSGQVGKLPERFPPELISQFDSSELMDILIAEDDMVPPIGPILEWIQTAPPKLEEWIEWVEQNGSRGLGAELAHSRELSGARTRFFNLTQDDRPDSVANVTSLKPKSGNSLDMLCFDLRSYLASIMHLLGEKIYIEKSKIARTLINKLESGELTRQHIDELKGNSVLSIPDEPKSYVKGNLKDLLQRCEAEIKAKPSPKI